MQRYCHCVFANINLLFAKFKTWPKSNTIFSPSVSRNSSVGMPAIALASVVQIGIKVKK